MTDAAETMFETDELEGLEDHFHNLPDVESPPIAAGEHEMASQLVEGKEISETPHQEEHQPEPLTTRELVSQELVTNGRGEGIKVGEVQGILKFGEDGEELFDERGDSITKFILESGDPEAIAMYYEMIQQFRDGGSTVFINKEQPGDEDPDTMHGSYMILNEDGSISWGLTERKIERGEEEEDLIEREESEVPIENRWTTPEHTEREMIQPDDRTEVLAQLAATHETTVSQSDTGEPVGSEEAAEQAAVVAIEAIASPTADSPETITHETIEIGGVLVEAKHEQEDGVESVSISEFLDADPLESLPVFEIQETTTPVPEAIVPEVAFSQVPQTPDIRETAMYQAIVALLKNDIEAIHMPERPSEETTTEHMEEKGEDVTTVPIENSASSTSSETPSQATESAQATVNIEATTAQITSTEATPAMSRVEERIDMPIVLRNTENSIRIAPEIVQDGHDRKIDEMESVGARSEASERQPTLHAQEILFKTLGIREKTVAIGQERPYNNTQRMGNQMIQLPSRAPTQARGRTSSKFGISLIQV